MRIILITPAPPQSRLGNRTTAVRWARLFLALGHRVDLTMRYEVGQRADLMIALHAWRSAPSVHTFSDRNPGKPILVVLTGTDIYRFQHSEPEITLATLHRADRLIGLHDRVADAIPPQLRSRVRIVYQSAVPGLARSPSRKIFKICVAGHLREEKDPLRPAIAVRDISSQSHIRIDHFGSAHSPDWEQRAQQEMAINPRYQWHGDVPFWRLRRAYAQSRLLVLPSLMEGGANVVSEAIASSLPIVASRIEGSLGLLGDDYPGFFPAGDTAALSELLQRAETDRRWLEMLAGHCDRLRPRFTLETETATWARILAEVSH
jgi:putative glycosyltransferase (TIGR04348 family)